jgi:hypothetical protein
MSQVYIWLTWSSADLNPAYAVPYNASNSVLHPEARA